MVVAGKWTAVVSIGMSHQSLNVFMLFYEASYLPSNVGSSGWYDCMNPYFNLNHIRQIADFLCFVSDQKCKFCNVLQYFPFNGKYSISWSNYYFIGLWSYAIIDEFSWNISKNFCVTTIKPVVVVSFWK